MYWINSYDKLTIVMNNLIIFIYYSGSVKWLTNYLMIWFPCGG